jgi:hypothetical protein
MRKLAKYIKINMAKAFRVNPRSRFLPKIKIVSKMAKAKVTGLE